MKLENQKKITITSLGKIRDDLGEAFEIFLPKMEPNITFFELRMGVPSILSDIEYHFGPKDFGDEIKQNGSFVARIVLPKDFGFERGWLKFFCIYFENPQGNQNNRAMSYFERYENLVLRVRIFEKDNTKPTPDLDHPICHKGH